MYPVKQSTALTIPVFAHDANGDAVTGLTDGSFTKRISKNGGAFAAMTVTLTEMENGWYSMPLSTSHTDTLGVLTVTLTNAGAKQINIQLRVHARLPDDLAHPTTSGRSIDVTATGAVGIDWGNVENPTTVLDLSGTDINLVDTCTTNTDMRGTDNAALASVLGALADAAAAGDPTVSDTVMAYVKQLINTLEGAAGIPVFPAEAAPANNVSLAEIIRAIHADVTGLNGDAMRGTDSAALASVCTEVRLSELDAANIPADVDAILTDTASIGVTKNAAFSNFEFPMVLSSDHYTAGTGLTVTGQRSIDGGAFAAVSGSIAEVGSGVYQFDALAADTNGDVITWKFSAANADDTIVTIKTRA